MNPRTSSTTFADLGVPSALAQALAGIGITEPFPIQAATLPDSLSGRDILGRGRTGSGKTLAYALPLIARLTGGKSAAGRPRGLVLVPTRELATQVQAAMLPLAQATGLKTATIFGGVNQRPQVNALARGADIVIACPGRLEDLLRQGHLRLDHVEVTVLDEADHMADLGFLPGVRRILDLTPSTGQRMLFSATLDNGVDVIVRRYLVTPVTHAIEDDARAESQMIHHVLTVHATDKPAVVRELASGRGRSVLFTRTKHGARKLAGDLTKAGVPAVDLHGNLSQHVRDRHLTAFRDGAVRVLVATDVAARGIHVDDIALVVHVDPPAEHKSYLHRSGRTARAGAQGTVVTLQTPEQRRTVLTMTKRAGIQPNMASVAPGSPVLTDLTGPKADHVAPVPVADPATAVARTQAARAGTGKPRRSRRASTTGGPKATAGRPNATAGRPMSTSGNPKSAAGPRHRSKGPRPAAR
ncbi:MAG: DEAD/DEAH box helicase [Actinomycetales bacterium]|nr:DEAD/DEAH box helicase [Actinomycetales bacterium]